MDHSLAGVNDLRAAAAEHVCGDAVPRLLAGAPPDAYRQFSPAEMLPLKTPARLVHGAVDHIVPLEMSRKYEAAAKKAGDNATLIVIPDAGHFELITPQGAAWEAVKRAVLSW